MANYKLQIDDFDEIEYSLIAIHSTLEDYRLAYFINKNLPINLSKSQNEIAIDVKEGETHFSKFNFDDHKNDISWHLIKNESLMTVKPKQDNFDLFTNTSQEISKKVYLLPEFKKVNYFLKIENPDAIIDIEKTTTILNSIEKIATVYNIDYNKIKNKNNLIF